MMLALAVAVVFASSLAAAQTPAKPGAPAPKAPAAPPGAAPAQKPPVATTGPAQKPGAPATPAAGAVQPAAAAAKPTGEAYTYDAESRRDPFISLVGTGGETAVVKKGDGPASMVIAEISVRGIMQSRGGYVAMVEGPDKKTYVMHTGDRFADGAIKNIMPTGLVIIQEVNDPLSLVKQREVRKLLRSLEDAK